MADMPDAAPQRVLGFDYGGKRIGMAFGVRITATATPLPVVANTAEGPNWNAIDRAVREWRPDALVVGLPLSLSGDEQPMTRLARAFAATVHDRYALPVHEQDERLTSVEADRRFAEARRAGTKRQKHAAGLDSIAAQIIVENFLAATNGGYA
jgi:putative holliday junction resolvase